MTKKKAAADPITAENVELVTDQTIEPIVNTELGKTAAEEAFMNEYVIIKVHATTDENSAPHVLLNVNGMAQPIMRGIEQKVRRKFVEVLARCKESKYTQRQVNAHEPDKLEMVERTALAYPFDVVEDNNPRGRAWLNAVLAERG